MITCMIRNWYFCYLTFRNDNESAGLLSGQYKHGSTIPRSSHNHATQSIDRLSLLFPDVHGISETHMNSRKTGHSHRKKEGKQSRRTRIRSPTHVSGVECSSCKNAFS